MSMLKIGDIVKHQKTGNIGKIIDYGYQKISDSYYLTTLRVELFTYSSMTSTVEDLFEQWQVWQGDRHTRFSF
ncbi:MAG: hypothetical protein RLZZ574_1341 [Cyanobacteriota bacterium]|jgi:hypothetical protein|nr:hypothetical protein [Pleurocapsa minor HA4230-MV1]